MKNQIQKFALAALITCLAPVAFGQSSGAATITGTVKDESGASVPGAAVVVKNSGTGLERSLTRTRRESTLPRSCNRAPMKSQ